MGILGIPHGRVADLKGMFQQDDSVLHSRIFQDLSAPAGTSNSKEWEGVGFPGFPINK